MSITYEELTQDPKFNDERTQEYIEEHIDKSKRAMIVVDNTPKVEPKKVGKLTDFLSNKIREKTDHIPLLLHLPKDDAGVTLGFAFVAFENEKAADDAARKLNGFKMDRSHQFKTNLFTDWEKYQKTPDEYEEPSMGMDKFCEENLHAYLCDPAAREQYAITWREQSNSALRRHADPNKVAIFWNDYQVVNATDQGEPTELITKGKNWPQARFIRWSPLGTYFTEWTEKGINLWGGNNWTSMGTFPHADVQGYYWSPKEKYLVTMYSELIVWDVQLGKKIRRVHLPADAGQGDKQPFKWSHDEQFLAKLSEDNILLYDLEKNMKLIQPDKERVTTIYMPGVKALEWSPTDNYFCYWVPESNSIPARVTLVKVITKTLSDGTKDVQFETIAQKNLFRVQNISVRWHPQGDFLACKIERVKKSNQVVCAYELFRIRHKECAVETIELPDQVVAFDFEPRGHRFCVVHGGGNNLNNASFYTMGSVRSGEVKCLGTFSDKQVSRVWWSPKGKYCLLGGLEQPYNGRTMEFWNVDELDLMQTVEHFMCTNVTWDASGRFVTTYGSRMVRDTAMGCGFKIWTFQGRKVMEKNLDHFKQFEWRPRPPTLLTDKDIKTIKTKSRATWEKKYSEEESWLLEKDDRERRERMAAELASYKKRVAEIRKLFTDCHKRRRELQERSGVNFEYTTKTETVEELIEKKEEKVGRD
eukprot:TRINITY_DN22030_c0_g1_i1.p1 TRINITY_DN22030_c0_g1~~TRINITY_DN22030_c0_g1_i1.p1  ORF type:complete len:701 (+),score=349.12 TRINITY_DN22030_c0_g1_i1:52-2154(+)